MSFVIISDNLFWIKLIGLISLEHNGSWTGIINLIASIKYIWNHINFIWSKDWTFWPKKSLLEQYEWFKYDIPLKNIQCSTISILIEIDIIKKFQSLFYFIFNIFISLTTYNSFSQLLMTKIMKVLTKSMISFTLQYVL